MNYSIRLDLLRLNHAAMANIRGRSGAVKRCLVVPVDDARLFLGEKGCYLDLNVWEGREPGRFGDTHGVKQSLRKEALDAMSEEERRALPFIGNMRPREEAQMPVTGQAQVVAGDGDDGLPF